MSREQASGLVDEPLWYKDAIFYELRVRSFYDSNGDGIGDFPGLTAKLDYLAKLGVTTVWLLPFYPSPLRDDGYDISDYMGVHPDCGTLRDFRIFLREAHRCSIRVVTELVLNHTSDQHPWFQRARRAPPGSTERDFYVWSDNSNKYAEARVIFKDFELSNWSWDPLARAYYWHRFYSHQPDLNYDNPAVRKAMLQVIDFWLGMGVDGLRLDAVPYIFERDGTSCENLPETHAYLKELRSHVDEKFVNRMLLAEANQWPEDAVAYLDQGRECNMAFHFPLMPRIFMAVRMEDRFPITDIWAQTPPIDETCQWALFLRNHDELTLEMVTDEERDFMYRAYAKESRAMLNLGIRRRLAPLLDNNRRTIELKNGLLFSLPGTPFIYYGDEIGMGDNVYLGDRDGVRTPMQWSGDRNAGFSSANPQRLILPVIIDHEYHYQTLNVEAQESNLHSLLWWMRRLIALRKQYKAFGRGSITFLNPSNSKVLAFVRGYQEERILVIANLSRFVQYAELDLKEFAGLTPVELFGHTGFPAITDKPYLVTLGPHFFTYFSLEQRKPRIETALPSYELPLLATTSNVRNLLRNEHAREFEKALTKYLPYCRWFSAKARTIRRVRVIGGFTMPEATGSRAVLALIGVEYMQGDNEIYVLPLAIAAGKSAEELRAETPDRVIARARTGNGERAGEALLYDAFEDPAFARALLDLVDQRRHLRDASGETYGMQTSVYRDLRGSREIPCEPHPLRVEQSNSSLAYGDRLILKLFRRLEPGLNPELEIGRFLTERGLFALTPTLAGWIEYRQNHAQSRTVAVVESFVPNQGNAWQYTLNELGHYFERAMAHRDEPVAAPKAPLVESVDTAEPDEAVAGLIGIYLDAARLMGQRLAELHLALALKAEDPEFAPEPFSALHHRSIYQSMRNLAGRVFRTLDSSMTSLPKEVRMHASRLANYQDRVAQCFDQFLHQKVTGLRMRCHGDLHLGQILNTGKDFVIIDFEGEPARPLSERRRKHLCLRDVAGMLRSFHYAATSAFLDTRRLDALGANAAAVLAPWIAIWHAWSSWSFLKSYLQTTGEAPFMPHSRHEVRVLLDAFMMEKAMYEINYELNNRPSWLRVPLLGVEQILGIDNSSQN